MDIVDVAIFVGISLVSVSVYILAQEKIQELRNLKSARSNSLL
jgi:hypothetical protein